MTVYIITLYQNLGLTGGVPLILGAAYVTVAWLSNFAGALVLDKVGRKPLLSKFIILMIWDDHLTSLVTGLSGCMISLCLETAMIAQFAGTDNNAGLSMGVFFSFCFISFYGGGIDVVGYVYCCEFLRKPQGPVTDSSQRKFSLLIFGLKAWHGHWRGPSSRLSCMLNVRRQH